MFGNTCKLGNLCLDFNVVPTIHIFSIDEAQYSGPTVDPKNLLGKVHYLTHTHTSSWAGPSVRFHGNFTNSRKGGIPATRRSELSIGWGLNKSRLKTSCISSKSGPEMSLPTQLWLPMGWFMLGKQSNMYRFKPILDTFIDMEQGQNLDVKRANTNP